MAKITKQYLVTFEIDTKQAQGWKNGKYDENSYPNWDVNYRHDEGPSEFANGYIKPILDLNQYTGITIDIKEKVTVKALLQDVVIGYQDVTVHHIDEPHSGAAFSYNDDNYTLSVTIGLWQADVPYDFDIAEASGIDNRVYFWVDDIEDFQVGVDLGDNAVVVKLVGEPYEVTEEIEI